MYVHFDIMTSAADTVTFLRGGQRFEFDVKSQWITCNMMLWVFNVCVSVIIILQNLKFLLLTSKKSTLKCIYDYDEAIKHYD